MSSLTFLVDYILIMLIVFIITRDDSEDGLDFFIRIGISLFWLPIAILLVVILPFFIIDIVIDRVKGK